MTRLSDEIKEKYPFLSMLTYGGNEYVGIIQNSDEVVLSLYNYEALYSHDVQEFLDLAEIWWWESNQRIPINLFLKHDWKKFAYTLTTFNIKDVEVKFGPNVNIAELAKTRSKRKNITLVKRVK